MDPISELNRRVDAYIQNTGTNATNLGLKICGNSALISRLRAGNVTAKTVKRIWDYLDRAERPRKRKAA